MGRSITIHHKRHGCLWWLLIGWWATFLQAFTLGLFGFKRKK